MAEEITSQSTNDKRPPGAAPLWQPGVSGNPGGRPSTAALRAALRPHEAKVLETLIALLGAANESVRLGAVKEFFDRLYGKCEAMKDPPAWLTDEKIVEMLS